MVSLISPAASSIEVVWTVAISCRPRLLRTRSSPLASEAAPGAVVDGPSIFDADLGQEIDNFEGLDVHVTADGDTVLTMVSDDNFSVIERTLLLQFTLIE